MNKPKLKKPQQKTQSQTPSNPSDFAFKATQIAVSQICQSVGYKSTQISALETLTHIATLYLQTLAKVATSHANASNRTQSNLFDLINTLHELSSAQGFTGGSTLHNSSYSLLTSSVLKDLSGFVHSTYEIPFAKPIPRWKSFPLEGNSDYSGLETRGLHIPKWLPGFPYEGTYKKECEKGMVRRGGGLGLWEKSDLMVKCCGGNGNGNRFEGMSRGNDEKIGGGDLEMERGRVRFKIGEVEKEKVGGVGVDVRNWVYRGRKRVCWNESGNFVGDEKKQCVLKMKR